MKLSLFAGVLFALVFFSNVYGDGLELNYTYVNSNSYPAYLSAQYADYYDNVDLRLSVSYVGGGIVQPYLPVVVSPVVYGVLPNGNTQFVYSVPSETVYVYPATPYEYLFNNMFYVAPPYVGYDVYVNAYTLDSLYSGNSSAHIYVSGQSPSTPTNPPQQGSGSQNNTTDCNDFYLSGLTNLFIGEDEEETYNLYIVNTIGETLTIDSVTTSNPSKLDIDDIYYPDSMNGYLTRSAQIDLISDTVSSDYSSSLDIIVNAGYGSLSCSKTYTVNYHIEDKDNESQADADDITFSNYIFTITDTGTQTFDITINNESGDYDYDIDEVTIDDDPIVSADVLDYPSTVELDSSDKIRVRFDPDNIDNQSTRYLDLKVDGYMTRPGREDKHVVKHLSVKVTIQNSGTGNQSSSSECSGIKIFAPAIVQTEGASENYDSSNGYYILSTSNKQFSIYGIQITDNSTKANITKNTMEDVVYPASLMSLSFSLATQSVNTTEQSTGNISVYGQFSDGTQCNYSDIQKTFNLAVSDSNDDCGQIGITSAQLTSGSSTVQIFNNTDKTLTVNDIIVQDNYNLQVNVIDHTLAVPANTTKSARIGIAGNGSAQLRLKGVLSNGKSCDYTETIPAVIASVSQSSSASFSDNSCDSGLSYPLLVSASGSGSASYDITLINNSTSGGRVYLSTIDGVVSPSVIYFNPKDSFTETILVSNIVSSQSAVVYSVRVGSCTEQLYYTNINKGSAQASGIIVTSYPSVLSPADDKVSSTIEIKNTSSNLEHISLGLSGFPDGWNLSSSTDTSLQPNQSGTIEFTLNVPEYAYPDIYTGYVNVYSDGRLASSRPLSIDISGASSMITIDSFLTREVLANEKYHLTLNVKNNSATAKSLEIDFNYSDDWSIQGVGNLDVLAGTDKNISFEVSSNGNPAERKITAEVKDKTNGKTLAKKEIDLGLANNFENGRLTALFSLSTTQGIIRTIALAIIVLVILVLVTRRFKK